MTEEINNTKELKFYSQRAIGIATFIGGPLAAGYLVRENYRSLGDPDNARKALILGIIATLLLFLGLFSIPEAIMEKIPNQIFPIIYTAIIYLIVEKIHGPILKQHKEKENDFHSAWNAAGVGAISFVILVGGMFGFVYLSTDDALYERYDEELLVFTQNETETLKFYDNLDSKSDASLVQDLDNSVIPKWEENLAIIERTNAFENLPQGLVEQNEILKEYAELRMEAFKLMRKIIDEDTDAYNSKLDELHIQINVVIERLN